MEIDHEKANEYKSVITIRHSISSIFGAAAVASFYVIFGTVAICSSIIIVIFGVGWPHQ